MTTFDDIEAFRRTPEAMAFAQAWITERKDERGRAPLDHVVNLSVWSMSHPHQALGITLNLIEASAGDEDLAEMVAMGPATEIVEVTGEEFTPLLRTALERYPKFALFTGYLRENSQKSCWTRLAR